MIIELHNRWKFRERKKKQGRKQQLILNTQFRRACEQRSTSCRPYLPQCHFPRLIFLLWPLLQHRPWFLPLCRHCKRAGAGYLGADRLKEGPALGSCDARKESWCTSKRVWCREVRACNCALFNLDWWPQWQAAVFLACTPGYLASTISSPASIPLTSAISCPGLIGRVPGCWAMRILTPSPGRVRSCSCGWEYCPPDSRAITCPPPRLAGAPVRSE